MKLSRRFLFGSTLLFFALFMTPSAQGQTPPAATLSAPRAETGTFQVQFPRDAEKYAGEVISQQLLADIERARLATTRTQIMLGRGIAVEILSAQEVRNGMRLPTYAIVNRKPQ